MEDHMKNSHVDRNSGFNSLTKTFHSLRPPINLPPPHLPLSVTSYAFSLRSNSPNWLDSSTIALINAETVPLISYSDFSRRVNFLAAYLQIEVGLSKGDVAFILSSNLVQIPILYFSLLSIGVVISPANPISHESEISRFIQLCKPVIAFGMSSTSYKLPTHLRFGTILLDSPEFEAIMSESTKEIEQFKQVQVSQFDLAAIMYSSATTGKVKGVMLTHRNLIAIVAEYFYTKGPDRKSQAVLLYTVRFFHVYGFFCSLKSVALSEAVVVMMGRFDMKKMLRAVEKFRVTHLTLVPPLLVAMIKGDSMDGYDLSSLEFVQCGAAPLKEEVISAFSARFPQVTLTQGYGLTEAAGVVSRISQAEALPLGSSGQLTATLEAKIVDPDTGHDLSPCIQGELWIRGPSIMKGYIGDLEATSATLVADGWLKTGDLCYIDDNGFLYVVDRLKELIKYKGYQVSPAELEQLLQSHPQIAYAAVIPHPDEECGEVPMAFVVRQLGSSISKAQVIEFVEQKVATYKKIRRVAFVKSIPKSAAGKILRRELRKSAQITPIPKL